jgi:hypothetical protein
MSKKWDIDRYCKLQQKREAGKLDKDEKKELESMAMERLFAIIASDQDVKDALKRLKDR